MLELLTFCLPILFDNHVLFEDFSSAMPCAGKRYAKLDSPLFYFRGQVTILYTVSTRGKAIGGALCLSAVKFAFPLGSLRYDAFSN